MKLTVALIVLCVVATGSAQQPEAPFKHPKAVQAWNRYQFRENKAREAYDREVAAAKVEYLAGLREAASLAAKAGDAGDVKAISEAMEGKPEFRIEGQWSMKMVSGYASDLVFSESSVLGVKANIRAQVIYPGEYAVAKYANGSVDRYTPVGRYLLVEHWKSSQQLDENQPPYDMGLAIK